MAICLHGQVAGALVIFEVQRSAKSEARKEEKRREELEVICDDPNYILPSYVGFHSHIELCPLYFQMFP